MIDIPLKPVEGSSNILAIGYDAPSQTLRVAFRSASCYDFQEVPKEIHASFLEALSYGVYFARTIKGKFVSIPVPLPKPEPVAEGPPDT